MGNDRKVDADRISSVDDWRVPYIGRLLKREFYKAFTGVPSKVGEAAAIWVRGFDWADAPSCESGNCFDEYRNEHVLRIELFSDGHFKGRIKSIVSRHTRYFETTSNWQDHGAQSSHEVRGANDEEIRLYQTILDDCTEHSWDEYILCLFKQIAREDDKARLTYQPLRYRAWGSWSKWVLFVSGHEVSSLDVCEYLQRALAFPGIWFLADVARLSIRSCNEDLLWFADQLDIGAFYAGFGLDLESEKKHFLDKLIMGSSATWSFMGVSKDVYSAMLNARFNERINRSQRRFRYTGGPVPRIFWGKGPFWMSGRMCLASVRYFEVEGIPAGSLCYFDRKLWCVGFVTPDGDVFRLKRNEPRIGYVRTTGAVFDAQGQHVASFDENGVYETVNGKRITYAYESHGGMVFVSASWSGNVMEISEGADNKMELKPYQNNGLDVRLAGMAFLSGVDMSRMRENHRIKMLEECTDLFVMVD